MFVDNFKTITIVIEKMKFLNFSSLFLSFYLGYNMQRTFKIKSSEVKYFIENCYYIFIKFRTNSVI